MAETKQQKLAREMSHKEGKANQSARDNPLTGSALQALARGWAAGTVGLPGDIEELGRMGVNALGGKAGKYTALPTTDYFKAVLPGKQVGDEALASLGSLFGGVGVGTAAKGARAAAKAAPGALTQMAKNAAVPRALSAQAGVIKLPGGNWLSGSVEDALKGLKGETFPNANLADPVLRGEAEIAAANRPLNQFIDKQLTRYVKNDMATERDPIRALAERGTLHYAPNEELGWIPESLANRRQLAGASPDGSAVSNLAKQWEQRADSNVQVLPAGRYQKEVGPGWESNMWLDKTAPDVPVHSPMYTGNRRTSQELGFDHLIDELRNATNPQSGLPRELLIKPESLDRVSVPQAVEHVAKINAWREAQKIEANQAIANNAATVLYKEYADAATNPKGLRWVELKGDLSKDTKDAHSDAYRPGYAALRDALKYEGDTMGHCVGGYCDDVASGKSRIYSLRDAKGQPHTTIETKPGIKAPEGAVVAEDLPPDVYADFKDRNILDPKHVYAFNQAAFDRTGSGWRPHLAPTEDTIIQIKGKGNRKPNDEYLPFVQDFVKSGKWSDVGDLQNTGLVHRNQSPAINDTDVPLPEGQTYFTHDEIKKFRPTDNMPEGYAKGGAVQHFDGGGAVQPSVTDQQIREFLAQKHIPEEIAAAKQQYGVSDQRAYTAQHSMSREDFLKKYGQTFVADDKGGNAASEVAGEDVGAYYDRYLAPGAKGDLRTRGGDDDRRPDIDDYTMPTFGSKYRDAHPYFDAWDNVNPHPESQDLGGVGEFWRQIGRPVATAAAMYAGVGALGGAVGGAVGGGAATAAGTGGSANLFSLAGGTGTFGAGSAASTGAALSSVAPGLTAGGLTGSTAASGLAGLMGMDAGWKASMLNTGALNTGVGVARGQDFGTALKGGVTSALLSPVGGFVGNAVGGGTLGTIAGRTAVGGLQGLATGRGLADGLQQGLTSGVVDSIGDYIGGLAKGQTGSDFAGKAVNGLTKSTLRGKKPGATLDSLATQYAAGKISDLSGLSPEMASVVVNLARTKKVSPVGALTALNNSRRTTRG